ncbi:MAG: nitroreductase family protein, partial [Hyphomicrobiaceae bacterium]
MDQNLINTLLTRRSARPATLTEPGPSADQLSTILKVASRVPDHKKLVPWRFIVFEGAARIKFGECLAEVCQREENDTPSG